MNRIYKKIWSKIRGCFVAVSEALGSKQSRGKTNVAMVSVIGAFLLPTANAGYDNGFFDDENLFSTDGTPVRVSGIFTENRGEVSLNGIVQVQEGAQWTIMNELRMEDDRYGGSDSVQNRGTIIFDTGLFNLNIRYSKPASAYNYGTIVLRNSSHLRGINATFENYGKVEFQSGSYATYTGTFLNNGSVILNAGTNGTFQSMSGNGSLQLGGTATLQGNSTVSSLAFNGGILSITGGVTTVSTSLSGNGQVAMSSGTGISMDHSLLFDTVDNQVGLSVVGVYAQVPESVRQLLTNIFTAYGGSELKQAVQNISFSNGTVYVSGNITAAQRDDMRQAFKEKLSLPGFITDSNAFPVAFI